MRLDEDPIILEDDVTTERCDLCRCYFVPDALLSSDDGIRLCWDCVQLELDGAEQTRAEVLLLEYHADANRQLD